ncbi:hypothetical protein FALCPG4_003878 [Fusarium falciforme]
MNGDMDRLKLPAGLDSDGIALAHRRSQITFRDHTQGRRGSFKTLRQRFWNSSVHSLGGAKPIKTEPT